MGKSAGTTLAETMGLLTRARGGDGSARENLLEHIRPRIVLWIAARLFRDLRLHMTPEDVAQDVLLSLHRALAAFRGEDMKSFYAWVFRIAENRIRDLVVHHQAQKRQRTPGIAVTQTTPATASIRAEAVLRVRAAIERLSDDHRRVIQLRQLEEREVPEVAAIMGRSDNAVRILHCRALKALREQMDGKA